MEVDQIFDVLPAEILCCIFAYLSVQDAINVSKVCRIFRELMANTRIHDYDNEYYVNADTIWFPDCPRYCIQHNINENIPKEYLIRLFRNKDISFGGFVDDFSPFVKAKSVDASALMNKSIKNIECLRDVKTLDLADVKLKSFVPRKTKHLSVYETRIHSFEGYGNLKSLVARDCGISRVNGLENVSKVDLRDNMIMDVIGLSNVKYLDLSNNPIQILEGLDNVEWLNISNTPIRRLNVSEIPKVKILNISSTFIDNTDELSKLSDLIGLKFNVCHNSAEFIEQLTNLKMLSIHGLNEYITIDLSKHINLEYLVIGDIYHGRIIGYQNLPNLKELVITFSRWKSTKNSGCYKKIQNLKILTIVFDYYERPINPRINNDLIPEGCVCRFECAPKTSTDYYDIGEF